MGKHYAVNRQIKFDKDNTFILLDKKCEVYDKDGKKVKLDDIKRGSVHTGFINVKWIYRDPGLQMLLLKLVVATKFKAAVEELLLDEL